MSDLKGRTVFHGEDEQKEESPSLTSQTLFDDKQAFVISESVVDLPIEQQFEEVVRPKKKRRWLFSSIFAGFSGLVVWQSVDTLVSAFSLGDWLTIGWASFIAALSAIGLTTIGREWLKLRKLRHHFSVQEQSEALLKNDSVGQGVEFCKRLAAKTYIQPENPHFDRWSNSVKPTHSDAEILTMYQSMVMKEQDKRAMEIVSKLSGEAAILVAVSPLAIADMLLIAWRNFRMIDQLSLIYGVELGYWSRIKLFKLVLVNMALAGASELAIETSADLLSLNVVEKISARAGQGVGVGLLTARLGIRTISLLRPIPFAQDDKPKLGAVRSAVIDSLKGKLAG
jgi:putative membrane protein